MDGVDPEALILLGALLPVIVLAPLTLLVTVFGVCMARGEGMVRKIFRMVWLYVAATVAQAAFLASGSLLLFSVSEDLISGFPLLAFLAMALLWPYYLLIRRLEPR